MTGTAHAIIFDWNGTLIDDTQSCLAATNAALSIFNLPPVSMGRYQDAYTIPLSSMYKSFGCSDKQLEEQERDLVGAFMRCYEKESLKAPARKGARAALAAVREQGVKTAILSNYVVSKIEEQATRLDLLSFFNAVLANDEAQSCAPFRLCSKGERLRAFIQNNKMGKSLVVGDTIEEIEIARKYGYLSIAIESGSCATDRLRQARPDFMISCLEEIPPIAKKVFGAAG